MQTTLFGRGTPAVRHTTLPRTDLGKGAWMAHLPHFLAGQDTLFEQLRTSTEWARQERQMYDRVVAVPRLLGTPTETVRPRLAPIQAFLQSHTGWTLDRIALAYYRDGQDSVAFHGDKMGAMQSDCVLAILSLGATRKFLLRPAGGGRSRAVHCVGGDLLVLGGTAQETWEHAVPKCRRGGRRIAVVFRPSQPPSSRLQCPRHGGDQEHAS